MTDAQLEKMLAAINGLSAQIVDLAAIVSMSEEQKRAMGFVHQMPMPLHSPQMPMHLQTYRCGTCGGLHFNDTTCPRLIPGKEIGT